MSISESKLHTSVIIYSVVLQVFLHARHCSQGGFTCIISFGLLTDEVYIFTTLIL